MFKLYKDFTFEASHQLPHHDGKCARLHGHSWKFTVVVEGLELHEGGPEFGMLADYGLISAVVKPLVEEKLDHRHLNDLMENPTSENIARWLFDELKYRLGNSLMHSVIVHETCTCACEYMP
jgi:6-pyruvoyltetrahydropterin/6-carboxytetrahydropterin synthase